MNRKYNFTELNKNTALQRPFSFLWPYARAYRLQLSLALLAVVTAAGTVLLFGWGVKCLIDYGFSQTNGDYLNHALFMLLGVVAVLAGASYTRFYTVYWMAERITADLRKKIFERLLTFDPAYFDTHKTGDEVARINNDTTVLQMAMASNLPVALRHALTLLGGITMLVAVSPLLTWLVLLVVPVVVAPILYFGRRVRVRSRDTQARVGGISAYSQEILQGLQTVQAFGYEATSARKFADMTDETFQAALRYIKIRSFLTAFVIAVVFTAIGIVLWAGGHKVLAGQMSAGDLSAFVFYAVIVAGAVGSLSEAMNAFHQATGAADRIAAVLSMAATESSVMTAAPMIRGHVSFKNVSFAYPSRPENLALEDVTFDVKAGEVVALVGPSGAGKTTLFQLLQRFYEPASGGIYIDQLPLKDMPAAVARKMMAVVAQDSAVFSMTVAENIRIAKPGASDDDVRRAAEMAQAHEFISALPEGYNTMVGERGSRLSGGQKQRIAIARALLKDARILLLDEATSALDASNEMAVHLALKNLMKGRTTLIIAHRLSTVQNADRIIVLDQGKIAAEGTHSALYGHNALYTHLAGLQMEKQAG